MITPYSYREHTNRKNRREYEILTDSIINSQKGVIQPQ